MKLLLVTIIEYVDDGYPGWVRAVFNDIDGREWFIVDKVVFFDSYNSLDKNSAYPQPGQIECLVVEECQDAENRKISRIDIGTHNGMNAEDGTTEFDVYSDLIIEKE